MAAAIVPLAPSNAPFELRALLNLLIVDDAALSERLVGKRPVVWDVVQPRQILPTRRFGWWSHRTSMLFFLV